MQYEEAQPDGDTGVRATNDDATVSKLSAVTSGYISDPFIHLFVESPHRRLPMINRGYFARQRGMETLLAKFMVTHGAENTQVVSIGAGFDTLFFRMAALGVAPRLWVELDFGQVVSRKITTINSQPSLLELLRDVRSGPQALHSEQYSVASVDARDSEALAQVLAEAGIDFSKPTFIVAECVLVYWPIEHSASMLQWIAGTFDTALFALYEQVSPDGSRFGEMMKKNLQRRGCPLLGLLSDTAAQRARFTDNGWDTADADDMNQVYKQIDPAERQRVERLEHLDEFEEHHMMQSHYCIAWGVRDKQQTGFGTQINLRGTSE